MPYDFWIGAERFYEVILTITGVLALIILMVSIYVLMYSRKRKKIYLRFSVSTIIILVLISIGGHLYYQEYLSEITLVNPLIRDRYRTLTGYNYYPRSEIDLYQNLNDSESLRKLSLYEEETVAEDVIYLGKGEYYHFFEKEDQAVFKQIRGVQFSDEVEGPTLMGSKFYLKDSAYKSIGFIEPDQIMYDKILIPIEMDGRQYDAGYTPDIPSLEDRYLEWNF